MDSVSMLNNMRFYCQPILPLVYDESMSYYETLCKVVGQLNTTGDTVNKLNEGLTDEITGRQEADRRLNERLTSEIDNRHEAERLLNERLKVVEEKTNKIHFLIFAGTPPHSARPVGAMPTRSELRQWINDRDMIVTLLETNDEERNVVYAMSCVYNAVNWTHESPVDFNIIVPISTVYDSERDYAVRQKIAKITIPPASVSSLDENWGLQVIEINTPSTSADGVVNLVAVISNSDSVNCSITPAEFFGLYNMARGGKNLCVAVNAKLEYDRLTRSSSVATVDIINRKIRIAFERDYGTFINNGVKQLNKTLDYIIGDVNTNIWTHETIDSKTLDFSRYEGFQFTRGENNVITANDESTPNAVYAQYHSDTSGKIYQNLPVRLIDTVDNAEYWNGVFDIKDNRHMTFTFVTSNYVTASGKMLVRVIELSADVNTTVWKYAEKEFELPISSTGEKYLVECTAISEGVYDAVRKKTDYYLTFNKTNNEIIAALNSGKDIQFKVTLTEGNDSYTAYFSVGYTRVDVFANVPVYMFVGSFGDLDHSIITVYGVTDSDETFRPYLTTTGGILPEPNPDDSDDGKVLAVNKHKWELKTPDREQLTGTTYELTPTQVYDAVSAGIPVKVQYTDSTYGLLSFTAFNLAESLKSPVSQTIVYYNSVYILAELYGNKTDNRWYFSATTLAQKTDIPSTLPNPNALTITSGSNSVTYDGRTAESIDITSLDEIVTETTQVLPSYTNLIPTSTDASGAVLNGVGYENGTLGSNGAVSAGTAFVSGFIPVKKGDVVRIKDPHSASFSTNLSMIALYKADKAASTNIGKYVTAMQDNAAYGSITVSGNVVTWDTSSVTYYFWEDFKYMRVMTLSADSIVTINEEIIESTQTVLALKPTVKVEKENLDFTVNDAMLAGRKIVVFGDSLIGMTRDHTSVTAYTADYTGATVYNVGFGGCRMSKHPTNGYAAFSMWALADAVATGNYTMQDEQAPNGQDYFASQLAVLKSIDFATVDAIVIHYGTNDFAASVPLDDSSNILSTDTVCGALRYSINKLLTAFPKIKIFVSLPIYRTWDGVGAETYKNNLEKTLPQYDSAMKTAAEDYNLPTIDGYKRLAINSINSSAYLSDGTHLNNYGRKQFGEFIGGNLICGT